MFFLGRTVLSMMDDALYVYRFLPTGVEFVEAVPWDRDGFTAYLTGLIRGACKGAPVFIINDMVEQYYRKERVFTAGIGMLDKKSMVGRKLAMVFPSYSVRAAIPLKEKIRREDSKMASDVYLFAATASSEQLTSTVSAVARSSVSSKGVGLLPLEAGGLVEALVKKLAPKGAAESKWSLLLGQQRNGNLRQIVVKDGDIALTRMTQITEDTNPEIWAADVVQEFQSTMNYLGRLGFQPQEGLDVVLISPEQEADLVRRSLEGRCVFYNATTAQAAKILGLKLRPPKGERYADLLHMAWIVKKFSLSYPFPVEALAPIAQARMVANGAGVFLAFSFLFMLFNSASNLMSVVDTSSKLSDQKLKLSAAKRDYESEMARVTESGIDLPLVQAVSRAYDYVSQSELDMIPFIQLVGEALNDKTLLENISVSVLSGKLPTKNTAARRGRNSALALEKTPVYLARLVLSFPGALMAEKREAQVSELRTRLRRALPNDEVDIDKKLNNDRRYVVSTADPDPSKIAQDKTVEIVIKGGAKP